MSQVTAAMVKELREKTGAGMMACKKALVENDGDMEKAETAIAKAGLKKAAKSEGRTAAEGIIVVLSNADKLGMALEVNSETDFVGRDESFKAFAEKVGQIALSNNITDIEGLKSAEYEKGASVEEARQALIQKIGENIQVRRLSTIDGSGLNLGQYVHMGRIGVLVTLEGGDQDLAKDIAMQIAACKPEYISPDDIPSERKEKEKEIFVAQAKESGKPADIIEKMVQGKLNKALNEICLTGQPYIKDQDKLIGQLLKEKAASIKGYLRFELGEGIEKKQGMSFAEEVAAQVSGSK
ncbi:MAG: elongation factor Ts [Legionellales bacterium]|nr:elongation factor Ts [Legionellales bacterium]